MGGVARFLVVCLLVVCAIPQSQQAVAPYKEFDPYPFVANTTTCDTLKAENSLGYFDLFISVLRARLAEHQLADRLVINQTELFLYAEDFGHIIHALPVAAFVPRSTLEVSIFVLIANLLNTIPFTKFQIVVRGGSGNVQGATQASCSAVRQVILDTTYLNSVEIKDTYAWVGPGAPWLTLVQAAAAKGRRPTVIPDYLGITLGGFMSAGGFGADTPVFGPACDQVLEFEVVTPSGIIILAGPGHQYFDALRGGMGVFGVITRIKLRLESTKTSTTSIHILTQYYNSYLTTMKSIIENQMPSRVHTIQSFAIPNNEASFEAFVAPASDLNAVRPNVDAVLQSNVSWVYYIELVVRWDDVAAVPSKTEVGGWLAAPLDPVLVFFANYSTPDWDNRLKLFSVPILVATGAWYVPKPWTIVAFPDTSAQTFDDLLQPLDPVLDVGMGLIALYPCVTSKFSTNSFLAVPRSTPIFYLATFGRNELTGSPAILSRQERGNRQIWDTFSALGEASIYASSYITDFGPSDWAHSYSTQWQSFLQTKKALDPLFIFGDQRNFGFASLYP